MDKFNEVLFNKLISEETYEEYNVKENYINTKMINGYQDLFRNNYSCLLMTEEELDICCFVLLNIADKNNLIFDEELNRLLDDKGNILCFTEANQMNDRDYFSFMCFINNEFKFNLYEYYKKRLN